MFSKPVIGPDQKVIETGPKYCCRVDRGGNGHHGGVWDEQGVRWKYGKRKNPLGWHRGNPFGKPDFVFTDQKTNEEVIIRRVSFGPSTFQVTQAGNVTGQLRLQTIFRNKYSIELNGNTWTFRMPLFTVRFWGESNAGEGVWVVVGPSKTEWNILFKPEVDHPCFVAALSFIHTEWWNYS